MALTATAKPGYITDIPADDYEAVCTGVYDIGTVINKNYDNKPEHRVVLEWELVGTADKDGAPFTITNPYTISLDQKANLRRILKSWRGRDFTKEEENNFNLFNVLGAPCRINIIHNRSGSSTYANVDGVMPWKKGQPAPRAANPLSKFSFEEDTLPDETIPKWIRSKIEAAPEFDEMRERLALAGKPASPTHATSPAPSSAGVAPEIDDDCPF